MTGQTTKTILLLSANPIDTDRLRFDEEFREINEGLRRSKYRERFKLEQRLAVRYKDLRRALLDTEPRIVHFIGHGEKDGLLLENETGEMEIISTAAISNLFKLFEHQVECVVLSACYSQPQADAINRHIDYVIGMRDRLPDEAGIEFAVGFYDALGAGETIERAFAFGRNAIMHVFSDPHLPVHQIPVLKKKT
jgi:hypothetical protein